MNMFWREIDRQQGTDMAKNYIKNNDLIFTSQFSFQIFILITLHEIPRIGSP